MIAYIAVFIVAIVFLAIADMVWLFVVSSRFVKKTGEGEEGQASLSQIISGISVYMLITIGVMVFVLPKLLDGEYILSLFYGGLFGFLIYGIYEGTNYFVIDRYSRFLATLDIAWGAISIAMVTFVSKYLLDKLS
ncbi:MAG: DUF2177 family protein [Patescibacteria group bacterium]